jgi:flagellar biosynthesis/type III secretory pathway chaperone
LLSEYDSPVDTGADASEGTNAGADPVADLLAVLEAQRTVYGQLLDLASERHAALAAADAERLSELATHEQPLLTRVRRLESARLQVVRPWADQLGLAAEEVTVSTLVQHLDPSRGAALLAARGALLDVVGRVDDANRRNAQLLDGCLASVDSSIQDLLQHVQHVQTAPRYAQGGSRAAQEPGPRITDYRA